MFIANLTYVKEISEIDRFINEHNAFLDRFYAADKFICSGRKVPRTGGIILINAKNRAELDEIIAQDPFFQNGVAKYEIIEFTPTKICARVLATFRRIIRIEFDTLYHR